MSSALEKSRNRNSNSKIRNSKKKTWEFKTPHFAYDVNCDRSAGRPYDVSSIGHKYNPWQRKCYFCGLKHSLRMGWRKLFSSCAIVSIFCSGRNQVLVVHTTMHLEYQTVVVFCQLFWFWREIVFGVTYVLSVQYSCVVVAFFCCGGNVNFVQIFLLNPNFLLVHKKFSSRAYAIVPQKYQELSMQVETRE